MLTKHPYTNFTLGLMALVLLTSFTLSAVVRSTTLVQEPGAQEEHDEDSPLAQAMSELKDNMRGLRKTLGKAEKAEDGMAFATGMRHAALQALPLWPEAPEGLSKSEQVKWRVDFQRKLLAVCDGTLQIELALAEGRQEDAKAVYKTLGGIKKEGHDTYDPDEE